MRSATEEQQTLRWLRMKFPHYDYGNMVAAQYRLVTEGVGIRQVRLVMGNSMGGMGA